MKEEDKHSEDFPCMLHVEVVTSAMPFHPISNFTQTTIAMWYKYAMSVVVHHSAQCLPIHASKNKNKQKL